MKKILCIFICLLVFASCSWRDGSVSAVGGSVSAVGGSVSAVGGSVSAVGGSVSAVGDSVSAVGDSVSAVGDSVSVVGDSVSKPNYDKKGKIMTAAVYTLIFSVLVVVPRLALLNYLHHLQD